CASAIFPQTDSFGTQVVEIFDFLFLAAPSSLFRCSKRLCIKPAAFTLIFNACSLASSDARQVRASCPQDAPPTSSTVTTDGSRPTGVRRNFFSRVRPSGQDRFLTAVTSALKSGSSLRTLLVTPEQIPEFFIPPSSPRRWTSAGRSGPLAARDDDDDDGHRSPAGRPPPGTPPRRSATVPDSDSNRDRDVTTRAALSLPHVAKVATPYGFRAVLAWSPRTRRRESLFHRKADDPRRCLPDEPLLTSCF
ncbi:C2 calcium-dependent domain-containing protein 4C-like, partial [Syngnathoides biaculeatus]|uniref:C2 calcium-dependent domain-containing protein 4C-like n=1 Tax=Syngnathoides biaculeatus TaxID=300417 RepID=UPI002ADDCF6D